MRSNSRTLNDDLDRRLFFVFSRAYRSVLRTAERGCQEKLGVTPVQIAALYALKPGERLPQTELGRALDLSAAALTGLVARMVDAGLIMRQTHDEDARAIMLTLTDSGAQIRAASFPYLAELNAALVEETPPEELEVVYRFLNRLITKF